MHFDQILRTGFRTHTAAYTFFPDLQPQDRRPRKSRRNHKLPRSRQGPDTRIRRPMPSVKLARRFTGINALVIHQLFRGRRVSTA